MVLVHRNYGDPRDVKTMPVVRSAVTGDPFEITIGMGENDGDAWRKLHDSLRGYVVQVTLLDGAKHDVTLSHGFEYECDEWVLRCTAWNDEGESHVARFAMDSIAGILIY